MNLNFNINYFFYKFFKVIKFMILFFYFNLNKKFEAFLKILNYYKFI